MVGEEAREVAFDAFDLGGFDDLLDVVARDFDLVVGEEECRVHTRKF